MSEYFKAVDMWVTSRCMHRSPGFGKQLGLERSGDWARFRDEPHFQVVREDDFNEIPAKFQETAVFV
jgi:hypothetical protein